jgi:hypothetical protein
MDSSKNIYTFSILIPLLFKHPDLKCSTQVGIQTHTIQVNGRPYADMTHTWVLRKLGGTEIKRLKYFSGYV